MADKDGHDDEKNIKPNFVLYHVPSSNHSHADIEQHRTTTNVILLIYILLFSLSFHYNGRHTCAHTHKVLHATDPTLKIFTAQPPEKLAGVTLIENII